MVKLPEQAGQVGDQGSLFQMLAVYSSSEYYFTYFATPYAEAIASWVRNDRELTWLAPGTPAPLTAEKVLAWSKDFTRRLLFWSNTVESSLGYAELNPMPSRGSQMWIGHFVIAPEFRGCSLGYKFASALLSAAFLNHMATSVVLVVFPDNDVAIRCYERVGMIVTGQETKFFDTTQREHVFLRMEITAGRYHNLVAAGRLPSVCLPIRQLMF